METENNTTNLRVASFSCYLDTADNSFVHKIKRAMDDPMPDIISHQETTPYPLSSTRAIVKASMNNHISQSPRVPSFSHYLDSAEENFAFKLGGGGSVQCPGSGTNLEKSKSKDGEIDIFGADRYFNMRLSYETTVPKQGYYAEKPADLPRVKSNIGPAGTPSVYSEASTWNSQTVLLKNLQRNASQLKQKKALGRRFFASLACKGPCLNKKDVYVDTSIDQDVIYGTKNSQQGSRTNDHYPTSVLNVKSESSIVKLGLKNDIKIDDPRQSLEVFGCKPTKKGDIISENLERKVSTLTWDAIPKAQALSTTTINSSIICDDMASDASSDLFELEHISGNGYGLLTTQESDNLSSCMSPTTEHYAPSEASIEWSVITASAAEFASVISDYEDRSVSVAGDFITRDHNKSNKPKIAVSKGAQKSRPGGLLGCKSHKAVKVAETHVLKTTDQKAKHQALPMDSFVSLGKLQASAKVKDIESLQSQQSFAARRFSPNLLN